MRGWDYVCIEIIKRNTNILSLIYIIKNVLNTLYVHNVKSYSNIYLSFQV